MEGIKIKYSLDVKIIVAPNRANIINAVKAILPSIDDVAIWDGAYLWGEGIDEETGNIVFNAMIRFHNDSDRLGKLNALKGVQGILHSCEPGSYIRTHACHNDTNQPCTDLVYEAQN